MKYSDFYNYLALKVEQYNLKHSNRVFIGPSISIKVGEHHSIAFPDIPDERLYSTFRFVVFPIKIYSGKVRHLNILLWDRKTKIIERYEPFGRYLNFHQINGLVEALLYKLMEQKKIYFLKYTTSTNNKEILNDKNCGLYCITYMIQKINKF